MRAQAGFTLVELVVVIVLMSIMSVASVQFIANMAGGYADLSRRQNMADVTQLAVERIGREVRNALPNSVRIRSDANASCIEFIPTFGASIYQNLPVASTATSFNAIPLGAGAITSWSTGDPLYVAVYPISSNVSDETHTYNPVYDLDSNSIVTPLDDPAQFIADQSNSTIITVTLASSHRFPTESPTGRFFIVGSPVSYCLLTGSGDLYRYSGYRATGGVFFTQQPLPASGNLGETEPGRALLADGISSNAPFADPAFAYVDTSLQRNALVLFDLEVEEQGESVRIQHVVQVRNAP
ncbi:MAG: prepilin-type N-terminal cleavage/methylation domain-containing protein [Pontibacterium sp.]